MNPLLLWVPVALFIAVIAARVIRDCTKPLPPRRPEDRL